MIQELADIPPVFKATIISIRQTISKAAKDLIQLSDHHGRNTTTLRHRPVTKPKTAFRIILSPVNTASAQPKIVPINGKRWGLKQKPNKTKTSFDLGVVT